MKLTNLVKIENYDAGNNGNLLVSFDENLSIKLDSSVDKSNVRLYIAGAKVAGKNAEFFKDKVDEDTAYDKIIVVNKKFMKLSNKKQLALLQYQNLKLQERDASHEVDEYAEVAAAVLTRKYHGRAANVIKKSENFKFAGEKKAGKALAKVEKKDAKQAKKLEKANEKKAKSENKKAAKPEATPEVPVDVQAEGAV